MNLGGNHRDLASRGTVTNTVVAAAEAKPKPR
jgi:hypothetical protein